MNTADISIVMACRNEAASIRHALNSMLLQEQVPGRTWEFLLADGMSDDGTRQILDEFVHEHPEFRVISNTRLIVSTGLNAAIGVSTGKVILRMDAHTEYASNYIRRCIELLEITGADNVGGPARTCTTSWMGGAIAAAYHSRFACGGAAFHNTEYEGPVDTVPYGCWPRELFDRVGLFDETLVRNQDDEFNLRITRAGGRIWQSPEIVSWYSPRSSLRALFQQYFQYGFWKVAVIRKHSLPASGRHLIPPMFVAALLLLPLFAVGAALADSSTEQAFWYLWLGLMLSYLCSTVLAAFSTARDTRWSFALVLPLVFSVYHVSYGLGFLLALTRHLSGRAAKPAAGFATGLTR